MDTLNFLKTILPTEGIYYLVVFKNGVKYPAHKAFNNLETLANAVSKFSANPDLTVYHACASYQQEFVEVQSADGTCKKKFRVPENWDGRKRFGWTLIAARLRRLPTQATPPKPTPPKRCSSSPNKSAGPDRCLLILAMVFTPTGR